MKELFNIFKPKERILKTPLIDKLDLTKDKQPKPVFSLKEHLLKVTE